MPQLAEIVWQCSGDIGGIGVSRFRFVRQNAASISGADVNAVAAAVRALYNAMSSQLPSNVTWTCQPLANVYDSSTGLVQGPLPVTSIPAPLTGSASGSYGGGTGCRVNWKTSTLNGRRLIRGATYFVPMGNNAYTGQGGISTVIANNLSTACTTYLNALTTALLYPVIWHRPAKMTFTGGVYGIVTAGVCSVTPAGLRSRRS